MQRFARAVILLIGFTASILFLPAHAVTLKWGAQNDILTFDPHSQNHATTNTMVMHVYEGLTRYGRGYEIEPALARFLTGMPARFETANGNPRLNGVIIEADEESGRAVEIERISYSQEELADLV